MYRFRYDATNEQFYFFTYVVTPCVLNLIPVDTNIPFEQNQGLAPSYIVPVIDDFTVFFVKVGSCSVTYQLQIFDQNSQ